MKTPLLTLLLACSASIVLAQTDNHHRYHSFLRHALNTQLSVRSNAKTTTVKDRLIGTSSKDYSNPPTVSVVDSQRYIYSGTRGSSPSPYDDHHFFTYYDNYYFFVRSGREDPTTISLFYDTSYNIVPFQIGNNVVAKATKLYDAAGFMTTYFYRELNQATGATIRQSKCLYTYDAAHNCTLIQEYKDTSATKNGSYAPSWIYTTVYSGGALMSDSSYDIMAAVPDTKHLYAYTGGNLSQEIEQVWTNGAWQNNTKETAVYDASGRVTSSIEYYWNATSGFFKDVADTFSYSGTSPMFTNDISYSKDSTQPSGLRKQSLFQVKLTAFGGVDTFTATTYNTSGVPTPAYRYKVLYNAYNHATNVTYYRYSTGAWATTPYIRTNFYYQTYNDAAAVTPITKAPAVTMYPIPTNGSGVFLSFKAASSAPVSVFLYDNSGRLVSTSNAPANSKEVNIPTANLTPGTYSVEVKWGTNSEHLRLIRE